MIICRNPVLQKNHWQPSLFVLFVSSNPQLARIRAYVLEERTFYIKNLSLFLTRNSPDFLIDASATSDTTTTFAERLLPD